MLFSPLNFIALLGLATALPAGQAAKSEKTCSATAFYDKKTAHRSGIIFEDSRKRHTPCYGAFWDGVDGDETQNVGLKDHQYGFSTNLKGYCWGNITVPGYVGGAQNFLLGIQMAVGSASGLLSSSVVQAMYDEVTGQSVYGWKDSTILPSLSKASGSSLRSGIVSVWNGTLFRAVGSEVNASGEGTSTSVNSTKRSSDFLDWNVENKRQMASLNDEISRRTSSSDADQADTEKCDASNDDSNDNDKEEDAASGFTKGPEERAVYRAPWIESKPVYFHGQCDECDEQTGFDCDGYGSFQSCSLIYEGQEYKGKISQNERHHLCTVKYSC